MRVIKFRAWDKKEKEMFYEDDIKISFAPDTDTALTELNCFFDSLDNCGYEDGHTVSEGIPDEKWILMQYTGLKDSKNREIWEGDVVRFMELNLVVEFHEAHFMIVDFARTGHEDLWKALKRSDVEVIGNKFENPELLNKK